MRSHIPRLMLLGIFLIGTALLMWTDIAHMQDYPNTPGGVTQKFFDSIAENDANKYLDTILPQERALPGIPYFQQIVQMLFSKGGFGQVEISGTDFRDLVITEITNDGTRATVQVTGFVRNLNLAVETPLNESISLVNQDGIWYISLYIDTAWSVLLTPQGSSTSNAWPRDLIAPELPEQIAASLAFEKFMEQARVDYRNASYETIENTGTSAIVEITADVFLSGPNVWIQHSINIPMRFLGGVWRGSTDNFEFVPTELGLAQRDAARQLEMQSTQAAIDQETQNYLRLAPGILAYVLEDGHSIHVRLSDGSTREVTLDVLGERNIASVQIVPDGSGVYISSYSPRSLYKYSFSDSSVDELRSFSFGGGVTEMAVSPDNTKIAISFPYPDVFVFAIDPNRASEFDLKWPGVLGAIGLVWASDSSTLYARSEDQLLRLSTNDPLQIETLSEFPSTDLFGLLALSPAGSDIFYGGESFGIYSIEYSSIFDLTDGYIVCRPTYNGDGSKVVAVTWDNQLAAYDLMTGSWETIFSLVASYENINYYRCPIFDWLSDQVIATNKNLIEIEQERASGVTPTALAILDTSLFSAGKSWRGMFDQAGYDPYEMIMTIGSITDNIFTASLEWPSLGIETTQTNGTYWLDYRQIREPELWTSIPDFYQLNPIIYLQISATDRSESYIAVMDDAGNISGYWEQGNGTFVISPVT